MAAAYGRVRHRPQKKPWTAMTDLPRTRLFVDTGLAAGAPVALDGDRAHYLGRVLRLQPGQGVLLFNGRDGEWRAEIETLSKSAGRLVCRDRTRDQPAESGPWLLFAPLKGGRTEYVVEKATELGAALIRPVLTRRGDVHRVNRDRMQANAVEAAEQCERLSVPAVAELLPLDRALADWPADRLLYVAAESGSAQPLRSALAAGARPAAFLVGPEGGFDPAELDGLQRLPFVVPVGLGPRILRADTAAFSVLAAWQALAGDWTHAGQDQRPPHRHP